MIESVKRALLSMQRYSWEQGVAMQAFYECGDDDVVIAMAKAAAYRNLSDGRLANMGKNEGSTDAAAVGEALLYAIKLTEDADLKTAQKGLLDWVLNKAPRNGGGILYHVTGAKEFWVDSIYMLPPYLAACGLYDEALKQLYAYWNALFNAEKGLLSHMYNDETKTFTRKAFWGVGNGWAMAGLARVIDSLPKDFAEERSDLIDKAQMLIESVSGYITKDGYAHDFLDDKDTFLEVNLPQMLAYTICRGIKGGWLIDEQKKYFAIAQMCRKRAKDCVDKYGLVQGVCGAPHFISPGVAAEAQAFFIMMEEAFRNVF